MKGIVEAGKVDRRGKDRLCGSDESQRLRDVQRREMCGGTKLVQNMRRDELVGAEFGPSVYHAMAYGHWSCVNMIPDCRCESRKGIGLRFEDTFLLDRQVSVGEANLECAIAASNALGASSQQRLFISITATGPVIDAELQRRRTAVEYEDEIVFSREVSTCLAGPFPVANLFLIDALGVGIVDALDDLTLQPFFDVSADGRRRGTRSMTSIARLKRST